MPRSARRRWFRVSVRGLMVLVLVAGGLVGWVMHQVRGKRAAVVAVRQVGHFGLDLFELPVSPGDPWQTRVGAQLRDWFETVLGDEVGTNYRTIELETRVTTATLAQLAWFPTLELLRIKNSEHIDTGWRSLRDLPQLRVLNLTGSGVDDAALREIGQIETLESLTLTEISATDAGLLALRRLRKLDDLTITRSPRLTDGGLARFLAGLPPLHWLTIQDESIPVSATLLELVRYHPRLHNLDLAGVMLTDADLATIARLSHLVNLNLDRTGVTDAGLAHLVGLGELAEIQLNGTRVGDAGLRSLGAIGTLNRIELHQTAVTDAGLVHLSRLPLDWLKLNGTAVTDAGLATIGGFPMLTMLTLNDLPRVTDAGLVSLQGIATLRSLHLRRTGVTAAGVATLKQNRPFVQIYQTP